MPLLTGAVDVHAVVYLGSVRSLFVRLSRLDVKKTFNNLKGPAVFDQRHHWRTDEAPWGNWPGLAPSTLERRTRKRGRDKKGRNRSWPKKLLGRFPTAVKSTASGKSLVVESRVKRFSMIHNRGGIAGHGARIPSRQYMWISPWRLQQVEKHFTKALQKAASG
jgi:phage gpG-like protein